MTNILFIILIMMISTSSGKESHVTLQRINQLDQGKVPFTPFVENILTFSSLGHMRNTAAGHVSRKPATTIITHVQSSPLITVSEKTANFPDEDSDNRGKAPLTESQKNYFSLITNADDTTSGIDVAENPSNNQSPGGDEGPKPDHINNNNNNFDSTEMAVKSTLFQVADGNQSIMGPTLSIDTEKLVVIEESGFNLKEYGNKSFINVGSVVDQGELVSQQRERKIVVLEEKLKSQGVGENSSLLYAISLLHQHINTSSILEEENPPVITSDPPDMMTTTHENKLNRESINDDLLLTNHKIQLKKIPRLSTHGYKSPLSTRPSEGTTSTAKSPTSTVKIPKSTPTKNPHAPAYRSFILLLDGSCMQIRTRMNVFVKYLKGTLATKLGAEYSDIRVPSVVCDKSFVVNVSFDEHKYPEAYAHLRALAASNATLLEISGHIFYLEKVLTSLPSMQFRLKDYLGGDYELRVIAFVSAICMCVFVAIAVATFYLLKCYYCRSRAQMLSRREKEFLHDDHSSPNIIYSANFSSNLLKGRGGSSADPNPDSGHIEGKAHPSTGLRPFSFGSDSFESFNAGCERGQTFSKSPSQLRLMEEIQEDDEYFEESPRSHENSEC